MPDVLDALHKQTAAAVATRPTYTHFCHWDIKPGARLVIAYCGRYIRPGDHANDPTCPTCRAILADREGS